MTKPETTLSNSQAVLNAADLQSAIAGALSSNQVLPGRYEVKRMVNCGDWVVLGKIFGFTPVYFDSTNNIDWRCVPAKLTEILYSAVPESKRAAALQRHGKNLFKDRVPQLEKKRLSNIPDRQRLYCEQDGHCHYCGQHILFRRWTVDHRVPYGRGGISTPENKVGCCFECNNRKGPLTADEFLATDYCGGQLNFEEELAKASALAAERARRR